MSEEAEASEIAEDSGVGEATSGFAEVLENYDSEIKATADMEASAREKVLQEAQDKVTEQAAEVQSRVFDFVDGENAPSEEDVKKAMDKLNDIASLDAIEDVYDAVDKAGASESKETLDKMSKTTETLSKGVESEYQKVVETTLDSDTLDRYKEAKDARDKAAEEYADAIKKKVPKAELDAKRSALESAQEKMNEITDGNQELADKIESKLGKRGKVLETLQKFSKVLSLLGGLAGLIFACWLISHELTGCYQYIGDKSSKLDCPTSSDTCGCGNPPSGMKTTAQLAKVCCNDSKSSCTKPSSQYKDYPFCCDGISTGRPTCTGTPGDDGSVYYAWKKFTAAGIIGGIPGDIKNLINASESGIENLMQKILKWAGIALAIVVIVYIILAVGKQMLKSTSKKSQFNYNFSRYHKNNFI